MRVSKSPSPWRDAATEARLASLKEQARAGKTLFGMANATTIGYHSLHEQDTSSSDCKDVTGHNPGYIEDDFMWFAETGPGWDSEAQKKRHLEALRIADREGSLCGFCWHLRGRDSHSFRFRVEHGARAGEVDRDALLARTIVKEIHEYRSGHPMGSALAWLVGQLDSMAIPVFKDLGFPLVFRPFHEMNGAWFWWGSEALCAEEYIELYRFTVDWIRGRGVRNLLYAWSPNTPFTTDYYPGDEWVDIVGLDSYEPGAVPWNDMDSFTEDLRQIHAHAAYHGKLAAICETGCRKEGDTHRYPTLVPRFWTRCVLAGIEESKAELAWVLSWYQIDYSRKNRSQCYIPFKGMAQDMEGGAAAVEDFIAFTSSDRILMQEENRVEASSTQAL